MVRDRGRDVGEEEGMEERKGLGVGMKEIVVVRVDEGINGVFWGRKGRNGKRWGGVSR